MNKWIKKDLMGGGFKATETELLFSDRLEVNYFSVSKAICIRLDPWNFMLDLIKI